MLNPTELIRELVAIPGPPGQEEAVRAVVEAHVAALGYQHRVDAKGNLIVPLGGMEASGSPHVVVTAHLDEVALMVSRVEKGGNLRVVPLGGLYPWKWGEQSVEIWTHTGPLPGVISFGSIHTDSPVSVKEQARTGPLVWEHAAIFTGMSYQELTVRGVRPGVRVTLARERRMVLEMGHYLGSYFLDDRADLAAWLLTLEALQGESLSKEVIFAATVSEEVGGEGARYLLHKFRPDLCIALEIGPRVPESPLLLDDQPTVWVNDSYASTSAHDLEIVAEVCKELGLQPHWQALSSGGSDASCSAQLGFAARPITFGLPVENSHGFEIMHRDAPVQLARLVAAYLRRDVQEGEPISL